MKTSSQSQRPTDLDAAASAWIARRDAGLSEPEAAEFSRWAAEPQHARALARHEQAWQFAERPRLAGVGAAVATEVRQRTAQRRRQRQVAVVGAALVLTLLAGLTWRSEAPAENGPPTPIARAPKVHPRIQHLPDGSIAELSGAAEMQTDFSGTVRRVTLLRGAAHFTVQKDAARPFVVSAHGVEVRAVGTAFAVEMETSAVQVVVTEGTVAVEGAMEPGATGHRQSVGPRSPLQLTAGQEVHMPLAKGPAAVPPLVMTLSDGEIAARLGWRSPRLEFTATPLHEAVALMNQYNRVQFEIADPAVARVEVSGYFRADHADAFLRLIEHSLAVRGDRHGDRIVLRR